MEEADGKTVPEEIGRGRVEALSDGVFAIVITLLVLEIKVPHVEAHDSITALADALLTLAPKFVSWVISFVTVCVIWLNRHRMFTLIGRIDNGLFWRNGNLLLWTSFIPFPTALMAGAATSSAACSRRRRQGRGRDHPRAARGRDSAPALAGAAGHAEARLPPPLREDGDAAPGVRREGEEASIRLRT